MPLLAQTPRWLWELDALPLWARLAWLVLVGAAIGSFLNVCILRIPARRPITGRSKCGACGATIHWWQNLPIVSWLILRGRCGHCGARFSIRYLFVEILTAGTVAGLYWWVVDQRGLYPEDLAATAELSVRYVQWLGLAMLSCFLIVSAFIDIDHYLIPDEVTIPGTLLGLFWLTLAPSALPPTWTFDGAMGPLTVASTLPSELPLWLTGGQPWALAIGIGCLVGWTLALWPWQLFPWSRRVRRRAGAEMAWACFARHALAWESLVLYTIALVGSLLVSLVWWVGGWNWVGLITSLGGIGIAGGILWSIRIVARLGAGREALGFGDVTLVAMIAAFVGWQAAILGLFLGAFYGLAIALVRLILGDSKIQFGPAICLGAITTMVFWPGLWERLQPLILTLGSALVLLLPLMLGLMLPLLLAMRVFREWMGGAVE